MKTRLLWSILTAVGALCVSSAPASAQWLDYPTKGIPRTPDGKPNLSAPAPRTPDGKPDLSGIWLGARWANAGVPANSGVREPVTNLNDLPFQPWAKELFEKHKASGGKDDPEARCLPQGVPKASTLPYPFEIVNTPGRILMQYEMFYLRRQIYTDGRELPKEYTNPSWMGYSVGKWEGDEFVVDTSGFNDEVWNISTQGQPHSDAMHVYERFRRKDFGHMEIEVTIDDTKAYTKPWKFGTIQYVLLPDTQLLEFVCERNYDLEITFGKDQPGR